jgi:hypothetical protein
LKIAPKNATSETCAFDAGAGAVRIGAALLKIKEIELSSAKRKVYNPPLKKIHELTQEWSLHRRIETLDIYLTKAEQDAGPLSKKEESIAEDCFKGIRKRLKTTAPSDEYVQNAKRVKITFKTLQERKKVTAKRKRSPNKI